MEAARKKSAVELAFQQSAPIETALSAAWSDIQEVKEEIGRLLSSADHHADVALKLLNPPVERLTDSYARYGAAITEEARNAWHSAKNLANTVTTIVQEHSPKPYATPVFPPDAMELLRSIRRDLSERQLLLGKEQQTVRDMLLTRILQTL